MSSSVSVTKRDCGLFCLPKTVCTMGSTVWLEHRALLRKLDHIDCGAHRSSLVDLFEYEPLANEFVVLGCRACCCLEEVFFHDTARLGQPQRQNIKRTRQQPYCFKTWRVQSRLMDSVEIYFMIHESVNSWICAQFGADVLGSCGARPTHLGGFGQMTTAQ
jgi:hypothetical protein